MKEVLYKQSFKNYESQECQKSTPLLRAPKNPAELSRFNKYPVFTRIYTYKDEDTFVKNFSNPLFEIYREHCYIIVEEDGEKISLKFFYGNKYRRPGVFWFKTSKNVRFITVNRRTGDIYQGYLLNYQKKKTFSKSIKKNFFLNEPLNTMASQIKSTLSRYVKGDTSKIVLEAIDLFTSKICDNNYGLTKEQTLLKFYLDKKNVKYPNNFWVYKEVIVGKEYRKFLKRNDFKMIDTIMQLKNLKGKKLKKYLHEIENFNFSLLSTAIFMFGEDWLNQDDDIIKKILNSKLNFSLDQDLSSIMSNEELKKVYNCFKTLIIDEEINLWTFADHIRMYCSLKEYGETIKWTSTMKSTDKFHQEHLDWLEKLEHYRKGTYTRIYPNYFHQKIEKPIGNFHPKILCSSLDYNSESLIQNNCVKGYIGRSGSLIISLRKESIESDERATIQYLVTKKNDTVKSERVQYRGKFNTPLPEDWDDVLLKLDDIVLSCYQDKKFEPVVIKKVCSNGVELESNSHFNENGNLEWSNKKEIIITEW